MKRKLITILSLILVVALGLGIFAACKKGLTDEQLDKLYNEFTKQYRDEATESPTNYYVSGVVSYTEDSGNKVSANVKWTIEGTTEVTVATEADHMERYLITVPEEVEQAINYKLVGTLVDENDKAYTNADGEEYKYEINKVVPAGKTYKLVIRQLATGKVLYAVAQAASTYYVGSVEEALGSADFHTEAVEGGYKIYTMTGSVKNYLGAAISGSHNNIVLGGVVNDTNAAAYQGSVWTISDDLSEIKTVVDGKTLYLGTYGSNKTFSVSETKTYPAFLVVAGTEVKAQVQAKASSANDSRVTVTFTSPAPVDGVVVAEIGSTVKFTVALQDGIELVSVKVSQGNKQTELTAADGVYSFELTAMSEVIVETNDPNARKDELMATLTIDGATGTIAADKLSKTFTYVDYPSITLVNNKASSTSALTLEYDTTTTGCIRMYASSNLTLNCEGMLRVVITTPYAEHADVWDNVTIEGATVAKKGLEIIITFENAVNTFTTSNFGGQTRVSKVEIYGAPSTGEDGEAKIGTTKYDTLAQALTAATAGQTITLQKDVVVTTNIVVNKKITLNLNGHTISNTTDIYNETTKIWSLISVRENGELTITGDGKLDAKENDCFAVDVREGGKLTIENGEYVGNLHSIYVLKGSAVINGGKYDLKQLDTDKIAAGGNGHEFTLNLKDEYGAAGTATITVYGGSFVNYDPANSNSEVPKANFVAKGYASTSKTEGANTVYTVGARVGDGTENNPYTASQVKAIGDKYADKAFSDDEVYAQGYVLAAGYEEFNSQYSSITFYISDTANGNQLVQVYQTRLTDATKIPHIGDLVTVRGYIQKYGNKIEFAAKTVDGSKVYPVTTVDEVANGSVKVAANTEAGIKVTFTPAAGADGVVVCPNGTELTFTVAVNVEGKEVGFVQVNGQTVKANNGVYTITVNGSMEVSVELKEAGSSGETSPVTFTQTSKAMPAGWTSATDATLGFYANNGIQLKTEGLGIVSPELASATGNITVKLNIFALNASNTDVATSGHFFTIEGLDENGEVVATAYIDTVKQGTDNSVILAAGDKVVKQIRIVMTQKPGNAEGKACNISLGGVTIEWTAPATQSEE